MKFKVLTVELCAEGVDAQRYFYATLSLPATAHEMQDAFQRARYDEDGGRFHDIRITECALLPQLENLRLDVPTIKELEFFANRVDGLPVEEKIALKAVFQQFLEEDKAVAYLIDAGKKDHDFAQYTLGRLFLKGIEVRKDVGYALRWLEEAVRNENSYAEYLLGRIHLLGEEVERDPERGEILLRKAAEDGNDTARYMLGKALIDGRFIMQDIPEGIKFITEAAENNFSAAQYFLGKLLYEGKVTPQDLKRSLSYLERAAARANTYAAYLAGKILLTEESVKDPAAAIRNFELAAQIGNDFAEYQLGKIYLSGKDVPQDFQKAMAYLTAASAHGNQYAKQLLHSIETNRNWNVATGSLKLLHHMSRMLKNQLEEDQKIMDAVATDRKIRQKEAEKKQLHGQKLG